MRLLRPTHLLALALAATAVAPASASADEAPVSEQIIVRYRSGADAADRADTRAEAETVFEEKLRLRNTEVVAVTDGTRAQAMEELEGDPDVLSAEPNIVVRALGTDTYWSYLWGLFNDGTGGMTLDADVDAQQAWTVTRGAGVTVAVVDTGVYAAHPDLAGRLVGGADFVNGDWDPADGNGHGTHVAGTIAATRGNGIGVAGLAPEAKVMPLKALPDSGSGPLSTVINAFDYAGDNGVRVVNASLGGDGSVSAAMQQVFTDHPNTIYVVAAGNATRDNDVSPTTPCVSTAANVLCVGATDATDAVASFSNYGATTVDLFAPGDSIASTYTAPLLYGMLDGTSMATPHVAAAAALVAAQNPSMTGADIATRLTSSVDPVAALAGKAVTGGRLNAARAIEAPVDAPSRTVSVAATGGVGTATVELQSPAADITSLRVYDAGFNLLGATSSASLTVTGLTGGSHTLTVVAHLNDGTTVPPKAVTVAVTATPAPAPVTPTPTPTPTPAPPAERPGTATAPTPEPAAGGPVSDARLVKRRGRTYLMFRVNRTARITVTLYRLQDGSYRKRDATSVRMAAGLQSLPVTSRLLGMRVPRGRWRVTVGTAAETATVAFTRR